MKYVILILIFLIAGCTSDNGYDALVDLQKQTQFNLQACQSSLEAHNIKVPSTNSQPEEPVDATPSEPQYETFTVFHIEVNGHTVHCNSRDGDQDESPACGSSFFDCSDGFTYRCMQNIKYKTTEEKRLLKE